MPFRSEIVRVGRVESWWQGVLICWLLTCRNSINFGVIHFYICCCIWKPWQELLYHDVLSRLSFEGPDRPIIMNLDMPSLIFSWSLFLEQRNGTKFFGWAMSAMLARGTLQETLTYPTNGRKSSTPSALLVEDGWETSWRIWRVSHLVLGTRKTLQ